MPKKLHAKLKRQAKKKGYIDERAKAYIYGALAKTEKRKKKKRK